MPSSLTSPCRSTDVLGDAFSALGIAEDPAIPLASGVEMELLRQRVIVVLMQQLSGSLGPLATQLRLLEHHGIVTGDALPTKTEEEILVHKAAKMTPPDDDDDDSGDASTSPCLSGTGVFSRFEQDFDKLELLGRGSFGEVWRCRHRLDGCEYAVKAVHFQTDTGGKNYMKLAAREARTMAGLAPHASILRYHNSWVEVNEVSKANSLMGLTSAANTDLQSQRLSDEFGAGSSMAYTLPLSDCSSGGVTFIDENECYQAAPIAPTVLVAPQACRSVKNEGKLGLTSNQTWATLYIQTELCEKDTLAKWIAERNEAIASTTTTSDERGLWAKRSYEIFNECVDGVRHMHALGCVHRDIKPMNILFKADGRVQLGDFGLAKMLDNPAAELTNNETSALSLATSNALMLHTRGMGTPSYASPEQLSGGQYGVEADVFSLGVVLAELLCPLRTQMERAVTLEQLHHRRRLPAWVETTFPKTARLVIAMTQPEAKNRPTMEQIGKILPIVMREMHQHFSTDAIADDPLPKQCLPVSFGHSMKCLPDCFDKPSAGLAITPKELDIAEEPVERPAQMKPGEHLPKGPHADQDGIQDDGTKPPHMQKNGDVAARTHRKEVSISDDCRQRGPGSKMVQVIALQLLFFRCVILSGILGNAPHTPLIPRPPVLLSIGEPQFHVLDETFMVDLTEFTEPDETIDHFKLDLSIGISSDELPAPERGRTDLKQPRSKCTSNEESSDFISYESRICGAYSRLQQHNHAFNDIISNVFGVRWRVRPHTPTHSSFE